MKLSLRIVARVAFLIVVLALLAMGGVLAWFTSWRSDKQAALEGASQIVVTPAGKVEFLTKGEGPAVLVFHGAPGGYDQAMLLGSSLADNGFQIIAPSRPGYLRTPLTSGVLPMQQADAMAALLDTLGVQSVAVLADSAGAPAAIEFALRYPKRIWALVLVSGVTQRYKDNDGLEPGELVLHSLTGDIGSWMLVEKAGHEPREVLHRVLESTSTASSTGVQADTDYILGNAAQLSWFRDLAGTFAPLSPRERGTRNDMIQIRALPDYRFEDLSVPTLIVHGTMDKVIPFSQVQKVAGRMPLATLYPVDGAGHLVQLGLHAEEVQKRIASFLGEYSGGHSQP